MFAITNIRRWRTRHLLLCLAAGAVILGACAAPVEPENPNEDPQTGPVDESPAESEPTPLEQPPDTPPASPTPEPATEPAPDASSVPPSGTVNLQELTPVVTPFTGNIVQPPPGVPDPTARAVQVAKSDLATRMGKDISEITLVSAEEVNWPDSSLGCPQKGSMYLQVITPGFKIVLELAGVQYTYHTDMGSVAVLCNQ